MIQNSTAFKPIAASIHSTVVPITLFLKCVQILGRHPWEKLEIDWRNCRLLAPSRALFSECLTKSLIWQLTVSLTAEFAQQLQNQQAQWRGCFQIFSHSMRLQTWDRYGHIIIWAKPIPTFRCKNNIWVHLMMWELACHGYVIQHESNTLLFPGKRWCNRLWIEYFEGSGIYLTDMCLSYHAPIDVTEFQYTVILLTVTGWITTSVTGRNIIQLF